MPPWRPRCRPKPPLEVVPAPSGSPVVDEGTLMMEMAVADVTPSPAAEGDAAGTVPGRQRPAARAEA